MDVLIELRYEKGRNHEMTLSTTQKLEPGSEFDLFGRHWRIVGPALQPRSTAWLQAPPRLVCVPDDRLAEKA
jgi:hypothetical protein